jgi:cytochrome c-type biogenesis protein CcmH
MMIWIAFAVLTALAALSVLVPLARARTHVAPADANDAEVYRAQLQELERDVERGLVDPDQAEAARTEIARRLIASARAERAGSGRAEDTDAQGGAVRLAQLLAIVVVPLAAIGLYLTLGSPDIPDQPLETRLASASSGQDIELLVSQVESHLAENPQDGKGWEVLAPVYMRLGRAGDAAAAYRNAIRLLGSDERRETSLGEALTMENQGLVSADAQAAFERAAALDPKAVKPRFFLALALGQEGKKPEAVAAWRALLEDAQGGEPWVPVALAELEKLGGSPPESFAVAGPSAKDLEAAQELSPDDRKQMIEGMVARLDTRLGEEGGSADEWMRLIRAYGVLGEKEKQAEAFKRAAVALKDDPAAMANLQSLAQEAGMNL